MRRILRAPAVAAVVASALPVTAARADPSVPQVDAIHGQREDAQRLAQQHRSLERETAPRSATAPPPSDPMVVAEAPSSRRGGGIVLLGLAGASALLTLVTLDVDNTIVPVGFGAAAVVSATIGLSLVLTDDSHGSVAIAPAMSRDAVGIALIGRL